MNRVTQARVTLTPQKEQRLDLKKFAMVNRPARGSHVTEAKFPLAACNEEKMVRQHKCGLKRKKLETCLRFLFLSSLGPLNTKQEQTLCGDRP